MPILTVLIVLIIVGVILWLVNAYIPMNKTLKVIVNVVTVAAVIIWLLNGFGIFASLNAAPYLAQLVI